MRAQFAVLLIAVLALASCERQTSRLIRPKPPAGTGLLFSSSRDLSIREIYTVQAEGSFLTRLTADSLLDVQPRWSPDGKHIVYIHCYAPGGYSPNVTVMNVSDTSRVRLTFDEGDANPSWSPDGSKIAYERNTNIFPRNQLWIINADGTAPTLVVDSLQAAEISWTPQDKFIAVDIGGITEFSTNGSGKRRVLNLAPGTVFDCYPRVSPDGSRVVFQWSGATRNDSQIYTVNIDGTGLQPLTSTTALKWYPVWSPDGSKIAFSSLQGGTLSIWTMDADGTNQAPVLTTSGEDYVGDWR